MKVRLVSRYVSPEVELKMGTKHDVPSDLARILLGEGYAVLDTPGSDSPVPVEEEVEVMGGTPKGYPVLRSLNRQSRPSVKKRPGKHRTSGKS